MRRGNNNKKKKSNFKKMYFEYEYLMTYYLPLFYIIDTDSTIHMYDTPGSKNIYDKINFV